MPVVYATPYDTKTLMPTGCSEDSGFSSVAQAREAMGEPDACGARWVAYAGVAFSDFLIYSGVLSHER